MDGHGVLPVRRAPDVETGRQVRALVVLEAPEHRLPVVRGGPVLERSREVVLAVVVVKKNRPAGWGAAVGIHPLTQRENPLPPVLSNPALSPGPPGPGGTP